MTITSFKTYLPPLDVPVVVFCVDEHSSLHVLLCLSSEHGIKVLDNFPNTTPRANMSHRSLLEFRYGCTCFWFPVPSFETSPSEAITFTVRMGAALCIFPNKPFRDVPTNCFFLNRHTAESEKNPNLCLQYFLEPIFYHATLDIPAHVNMLIPFGELNADYSVPLYKREIPLPFNTYPFPLPLPVHKQE